MRVTKRLARWLRTFAHRIDPDGARVDWKALARGDREHAVTHWPGDG